MMLKLEQIMNTVLDYLNKLNDEQKIAATLHNGSALILAAAGSGKTSTLTCRIAYLIDNGVPDHKILAVTFTNKAAKEMSSRIAKMGVNINNLWIGTFHGICNKILRYHAKEAGLRKGFYIMDQQEQLTFLKRVLRANGYDPKSVNVDDLQLKINGYKEVGWRSNHLNRNFAERRYYELYEVACKNENCVDFAELLLGCYELFKNNNAVLEHYQEKFQHILVDEFQDTNELQYKWIKLLSEKNKNVFAVGDDDQSIYSFRGADPKNMNLLIQDFNAKIIKIEKNYRSDANILEAANAVIKMNKNRQGKNLTPTLQAEKLINLYSAQTDEQESGFIAQEIKNKRRAGIAYKDMAILYRTNGQSRSLEKSLTSLNIPYIVYGGFRFFDRQEIKHAMAYLRLALNPHDNIAFLRVANIPARAIGDAALHKLDSLAQTNSISLYEMAKTADNKTIKKFQPFVEKIDNLRLLSNNKNLSELVKMIIVNSGLELMYEKDKKDGEERLDNLYELISAAEVFMAENGPNDIEEFLAFSTLETDVEAKKRDNNLDAVKLMTVHASKGLEFNTVFLTGLEENLFPHANSLNEVHAIEEERRLMYVALTRAKKELFLSLSEERLLHGQRNRFIKSRFLREIPQHLIRKIR